MARLWNLDHSCPKIVVYGIAKDEAGQCRGLGRVRLRRRPGHPGRHRSVDDTLRLAGKARVNIERVPIDPWRFDDARNAALALLPAWADICVSLDLDERLSRAGGPPLEAAWDAGITRPLYRYVWNWHGRLRGDRLPARPRPPRFGFRWRHPVHEVVEPVAGRVEVRGEAVGMEVHHRGDDAKDRSGYLALLEQSVSARTPATTGTGTTWPGSTSSAVPGTGPRTLCADTCAAQGGLGARTRGLDALPGRGGLLRRCRPARRAGGGRGLALRGLRRGPGAPRGLAGAGPALPGAGRPQLAAAVAARGLEITERRAGLHHHRRRPGTARWRPSPP